jgi:hypothetical protein
MGGCYGRGMLRPVVARHSDWTSTLPHTPKDNGGGKSEPIWYGRAKHPSPPHPMVYKWGSIPKIRHVTGLGGCYRPYIFCLYLLRWETGKRHTATHPPSPLPRGGGMQRFAAWGVSGYGCRFCVLLSAFCPYGAGALPPCTPIQSTANQRSEDSESGGKWEHRNDHDTKSEVPVLVVRKVPVAGGTAHEQFINIERAAPKDAGLIM